MSRRRSSILEILDPPGNQWLQNLKRSATQLPDGVRIVRLEEGESAVFESGTLFRLPKKNYDLSSS
ncbi:MAG: hypothetical protein WCV99_21625 [Sterolibacterium sp.]|jgi:hypothetical protein